MIHKFLYYMMAANIEEGGNYLDRFVPIVEDCIANNYLDGVSPKLIKEAIEKEFKFIRPVTFYEEILNRLVVQRKLIIESVDGDSIYIVNKGVQKYNHEQYRKQYEEHMDLIATEFNNYRASKGLDRLEMGIARDQILEFIDYNVILFSANDGLQTKISRDKIEEENVTIIPDFFVYLSEFKKDFAGIISTIVKAIVCYYYVYPNEIANKEDLSELTVFLDSPLLIHLLGYNGDHFQIPILEIVNTLIDEGATVSYFPHNESEAQNILYACENKIRYKEAGYGFAKYTVEYFLNQKDPLVSIRKAQINFGKNLDRFGVTCFPDDLYKEADYDRKYQISESELSEKIQVSMTKSPAMDLSRAQSDAQSISKVYLYRQGKKSSRIEESIGVFLTMNSGLVKVSHQYLKENLNYIPTTMLYSHLSMLLLLMFGNESSDMPFDILVSSCYAAISPPDEAWSGYVKRLNDGVENQEISLEEYVELRNMSMLNDLIKSQVIVQYDEIVNVDISTLKQCLAKKREAEIARVQKETKAEQEAIYSSKLETLKNEKLKHEFQKDLLEKKILENMEREQAAAKRFLKRAKTIWLSIWVFASIFIHFVNFLPANNQRYLITVILVVIGIVPGLPKDNDRISKGIIEWHLKKHGKMTKGFEHLVQADNDEEKI